MPPVCGDEKYGRGTSKERLIQKLDGMLEKVTYIEEHSPQTLQITARSWKQR